MNNHPEIRLEIAAHADDNGSPQYNLELSQKRAETMANYLLNKGIRKDRLIAKGYGKSRPISPSHSEEDRKINRRVQFIIINY
jgi:OmpA-OmpF porin, OOP family